MRWLFCLIVAGFIIPASAEAAKTASVSATMPELDEKSLQAAYESYINCHGVKIDSAACTDKTSGDINNDGVLDDSDYNLILIGLNKIALRKQSETPTPTEPAEPTVMPTTPPVPVEPKQEPMLAALIMVTKVVAIGGIISLFLAGITGITIAMRKKMKKKITQR